MAAELWFGAIRRNSAKLTAQVQLVLSTIEIVPLESPVEQVYGNLRTRLEGMGRPIGGNDLLIAAHSLALDLTLVTDNEREFDRIADLRQENWMR